MTTDDTTPRQALDYLSNAAVGQIGGVRAAVLFNVVKAEMHRLERENEDLREIALAAVAVCDDSQGVDVICEGVLRRHMSRLRVVLRRIR